MSKTKNILQTLKSSARTATGILDILPGYRKTYRMMKKKSMGYMDVPKFNYEEWKKQEENNFRSLLSHLKKDNLIKKKILSNNRIWEIMKSGLQKLKIMNNSNSAVLPCGHYIKTLDNYLNVVIFDIPEKFKFKRVWLRK